MARSFIVTERYILTGAPGAGKTVLIRQLEREGFAVVEEAATDVIALEQARGILEPWQGAAFVQTIAALQVHRLERAPAAAKQFHDRSLICTYALALFLGREVPPSLEAAIVQAVDGGLFMQRVFFIELLGFITPTAARRIDLTEAQRFEHMHEAAYRRFGFDLIRIPPGSIDDRAAVMRKLIGA